MKQMKPIEFDYFNWLAQQVHVPINKNSYNDLLLQMHSLEFVWTVPNDNNRVEDGLELRREFLNGARRRLDIEGASILEVLVALSRRLAFIADGDPRIWAWRLIKNLRLNKMTDPLVGAKLIRTEEILYNLVWRVYSPDGQGGFFPLKRPREDQTKVEVWYQMNAYVIEMDNI